MTTIRRRKVDNSINIAATVRATVPLYPGAFHILTIQDAINNQLGNDNAEWVTKAQTAQALRALAALWPALYCSKLCPGWYHFNPPWRKQR